MTKSTVGCFGVREKYCSLAYKPNTIERTGCMKSLLYQLIYAGVYVLINLLTKLAMPGSFVGVLQFVVGGFSKQQRCLKKRISQQYPFGVIYAFNMFMFIFVNTVAIAAKVVSSIFL